MNKKKLALALLLLGHMPAVFAGGILDRKSTRLNSSHRT